jgi:hypothetical protein
MLQTKMREIGNLIPDFFKEATHFKKVSSLPPNSEATNNKDFYSLNDSVIIDLIAINNCSLLNKTNALHE